MNDTNTINGVAANPELIHGSPELKAAGVAGFIPKQVLRLDLPVALVQLLPPGAGKTPKARKISPDFNTATKK